MCSQGSLELVVLSEAVALLPEKTRATSLAHLRGAWRKGALKGDCWYLPARFPCLEHLPQLIQR